MNFSHSLLCPAACRCPVLRSIRSFWPPTFWMSNILWAQRHAKWSSFRVCPIQYFAVPPNAQNRPKRVSAKPVMIPMPHIVRVVASWDLCTTKCELENRNQMNQMFVSWPHHCVYSPLVHMAIPLSITNDSKAIIIPNSAKYTQSSPSRANEWRHIHDNRRTKRLERLPNNSCNETKRIKMISCRICQCVWYSPYSFVCPPVSSDAPAS